MFAVPPEIKQQMESITQGVEDQEVTIECKADGKPSPEYEFYRIVVSVVIINNLKALFTCNKI